jgi:hypothetical protein
MCPLDGVLGYFIHSLRQQLLCLPPVMIGLNRVVRATNTILKLSPMRIRQMSSVPASASSSILFHEVVANVDGTDIANKISFKLDKGDRVALTGSNQAGCLLS